MSTSFLKTTPSCIVKYLIISLILSILPILLSAQRDYCDLGSSFDIYSAEDSEVIRIQGDFELDGKQVRIISGSREFNYPTKELHLVVSADEGNPNFIVFDKKGRAYCSGTYGVHNFPDAYNYSSLTKDRNVVFAGVLPTQKLNPDDPVRNLVNNLISKEDIEPKLLKDNILVECYKEQGWASSIAYTNVLVSPEDMSYFKDDLVGFLEVTLEEFGVEPHGDSPYIQDSPEDEVAKEKTDPISESENSLDNNDQSDYNGLETTRPKAAAEAAGSTVAISATSENTNQGESDRENENTSDSDFQEDMVEPAETENSSLSSLEDLSGGSNSVSNLGSRDLPDRNNAISEEEKADIQREAEEKLFQLEETFVKLVNRQLDSNQKRRLRESTVEELFINERATVAVSSLNRDRPNYYQIDEYLLRLENTIAAIYQKVEIVFSKIHKVSNFKPNPDGTWSATVTFSQIFKGYKDLDGSGPAYADVTHKNVTVKIKRSEIFAGDASPEVYWEVLLADIGVNQTEPF